MASSGLHHEEAAILYQIIGGWPRVSYFTDGPFWDDAHTLLARGLISRRDEQFVPTPDVVFSLRLSER